MSDMKSGDALAWLTPDYLQQILQQYLKDRSVEVHNVDIKPASASGENYASVMSRIRIQYSSTASKVQEPQELSFILKQSYENDPFVLRILGAYDVYNTEMKMYDQVLPQLAQILTEAGETEQLFAKTLKVEFDRTAILFEDLSMKHYEMPDRLRGMDFQHSKMLLKKLAKFHAAGAVLNERLEGALQKYDRGIFNRHVRGLGAMFEYFTEICTKYALECNELGPYYHDKLKQLQPHVVDYAIRSYNANPKQFLTLCHGDVWSTNIMLLYNECRELQDLLLIDFQFPNWSSPAVDLHYFFCTSLEPQLMLDLTGQEKLVQYYHSVLRDTLRTLNYKGHIPTLHEFCLQMQEAAFLAVATTIANLAVAIAEECEGADFHCLVDDTEQARKFRQNCYKNKRFQDILNLKLPYFDRRGLLDVQK